LIACVSYLVHSTFGLTNFYRFWCWQNTTTADSSWGIFETRIYYIPLRIPAKTVLSAPQFVRVCMYNNIFNCILELLLLYLMFFYLHCIFRILVLMAFGCHINEWFRLLTKLLNVLFLSTINRV